MRSVRIIGIILAIIGIVALLIAMALYFGENYLDQLVGLPPMGRNLASLDFGIGLALTVIGFILALVDKDRNQLQM